MKPQKTVPETPTGTWDILGRGRLSLDWKWLDAGQKVALCFAAIDVPETAEAEGPARPEGIVELGGRVRLRSERVAVEATLTSESSDAAVYSVVWVSYPAGEDSFAHAKVTRWLQGQAVSTGDPSLPHAGPPAGSAADAGRALHAVGDENSRPDPRSEPVSNSLPEAVPKRGIATGAARGSQRLTDAEVSGLAVERINHVSPLLLLKHVGLNARQARLIVDHRPFDSLDEMEAIHGIGPQTRLRILDWVRSLASDLADVH